MRAVAFCALGLVAGCSAERTPEPAPTPRATVAAPRTLVAADFDPAMLGARVAAMESTDVEVGDGLARVTAFVACPKQMTACDPAELPEGTVFTYVLTIAPEQDEEEEEEEVRATPSPTLAPDPSEAPVAPLEAPAELVRMTLPAPGFRGAVGFSREEAAAALGQDDALTVTLDQNRLIWRVTEGAGWQAGKPITLWWQSTRAPAKPAPSYRLEYAGKHAQITAPFPAADKPVERAN